MQGEHKPLFVTSQVWRAGPTHLIAKFNGIRGQLSSLLTDLWDAGKYLRWHPYRILLPY